MILNCRLNMQIRELLAEIFDLVELVAVLVKTAKVTCRCSVYCIEKSGTLASSPWEC